MILLYFNCIQHFAKDIVLSMMQANIDMFISMLLSI